MKHDIEKMKKEFEEKIRKAELENELNDMSGLDLSIMGKGTYNKQKLRIWIRNEQSSFLELNLVKDIFKKFPITDNIVDSDAKFEGMALLYLRHSYGDRNFGTLCVHYISGDYEINFDVDIFPISKEFTCRYRDTTDCENSTYTSIHESRARGYVPKVKSFGFNAKYISYYGGSSKLVDNSEVKRLIDVLINFQ